jgi:hypothetical protein
LSSFIGHWSNQTMPEPRVFAGLIFRLLKLGQDLVNLKYEDNLVKFHRAELVT